MSSDGERRGAAGLDGACGWEQYGVRRGASPNQTAFGAGGDLMTKRAASVIHAGYGVLAVATTAGVAELWGKTWSVTVLGAAASAVLILLCDVGLDAARRRLPLVRRVLDARWFLEGVWLQRDIRFLQGDHDTENRFGIFTLDFDSTIDSYTVDGTAYYADGRELAHWRTPLGFGVQVAANLQVANYDFEGWSTGGRATGSTRRRGNTRLEFAADNKSGTGTVVHVDLNDQLQFKLKKVTTDWLESQMKLPSVRPQSLVDPTERNQFALDHADFLAARSVVR
jgi:hypothetical protein